MTPTPAQNPSLPRNPAPVPQNDYLRPDPDPRQANPGREARPAPPGREVQDYDDGAWM